MRARIFRLQFKHAFELGFGLRELLPTEVRLPKREVRLGQVGLLLDDRLQLGNRSIRIVLGDRGQGPPHAHGAATPVSHSQCCSSHRQSHKGKNARAAEGIVMLRREESDQRAENQSADESTDMAGIVDARDYGAKKQVKSSKEK